jgi:AraC-like DNA-binding protein
MHKNVKKYGVCYNIAGYLSSVIDCVFVETYFSMPGNQGIVKRIVPDNTVELIITDKSFQRNFSEQNETSTLKSHISGLKTTYQDISLESSPLISIRFKPDKIFQLTQIPASEFRNRSLSPKEIFGHEFESFEDQLFEQKNTKSRLKVIYNYFAKKFPYSPERDDALFQYAKAIIEESNGNIHLKNLSLKLNVNQKTLENKFKFFLGVTPKEYCRLIRFVNSVKRFQTSEMNLTELAYASNFFDQSRLMKEYYKYTGYSPKDFFSSPLGIQEDIF